MKVVSSDNYCSFHLHTLDNSSQDTTTYRDITSKRTLLINICSFNCLKVEREL